MLVWSALRCPWRFLSRVEIPRGVELDRVMRTGSPPTTAARGPLGRVAALRRYDRCPDWLWSRATELRSSRLVQHDGQTLAHLNIGVKCRYAYRHFTSKMAIRCFPLQTRPNVQIGTLHVKCRYAYRHFRCANGLTIMVSALTHTRLANCCECNIVIRPILLQPPIFVCIRPMSVLFYT